MFGRKRRLSSDTGDSSNDDNDDGDETSGTTTNEEKTPQKNNPYTSFIKPTRPEDNSDESSGDVSSSSELPDAKKAKTSYSSFAQQMMARMGYKEGKGLGKNETGRVDIVEASNQRGRRGLGLKIKGLEAKEDATWNEEEQVMIRQDPDWIPSHSMEIPTLNEMSETWTIMCERKETINDEYEFCEPDILKEILNSKTIFDSLGGQEFLKARTRANPYETIRGAIFQNRAAMKMAEIDASFDFMFTQHKDYDATNNQHLLYFSDICAGPGGFSEYILWRGKWHAKGYGFTLRADWANDFKLNDFIAGTPETFDCHYGVGGYNGDGDIYNGDNLIEFQKYVKENTDGKGVHFVMADGGFSVEGQENIQEILSKQLYLGQFTCALSILRPGGHFLCKLFDIFTPFSVGLIYLMYRAFDQVCIFKPMTSRPANSERYIVCKGLREGSESIHAYMFDINKRINQLKRSDTDIREVVPIKLMQEDHAFYNYIFTSSNTIGARQVLGLKKLATYVQNTMLMGADQGEVRRQCLEAWKIPVQARSNVSRTDPDIQFEKLTKHASINWMTKTIAALDDTSLKQMKSIHDYKVTFSGGERCYLFSLGRTHVYQWDPKKPFSWKPFNGGILELPRFTFLDVEMVIELKGDGRGQRRVTAIHILDAIYLGEENIAKKSFDDRLELMRTFVKALSKPCRTDLVALRVKPYFDVQDIIDNLNKLEKHLMKKGLEEKLCYHLNDGKYFVPNGLYFVRSLKEPWHVHFSRSNQRWYYFNSHTKASSFERSEDSIATVQYSTTTRLFWDMANRKLTKENLLEFVNSKK